MSLDIRPTEYLNQRQRVKALTYGALKRRKEMGWSSDREIYYQAKREYYDKCFRWIVKDLAPHRIYINVVD